MKSLRRIQIIAPLPFQVRPPREILMRLILLVMKMDTVMGPCLQQVPVRICPLLYTDMYTDLPSQVKNDHGFISIDSAPQNIAV